MGKRILAIGTTDHEKSINRSLADFAASLLNDSEVEHIDMRKCDIPLFGTQRWDKEGVPEGAVEFRKVMEGFNGFIVSLAEHNGNYTAVFKNLIDWLSVQEGKVWQEKPVLLLSTSPGARGATTVLGIAENYFPHMGAKVSGAYSLGSYHDNFSEKDGITDEEKLIELKERVAEFEDLVLRF